MHYPSFFRGLVIIVMLGMVAGCFAPPHNNFIHERRTLKAVAVNTGVGAGVGAVVGSMAGNTAAGAAIGGVTGALYGLYKNDRTVLLDELAREDIQYIEYGDTRVLIIPTDKYFRINSHKVHDRCYRGLNNIVRLLRECPCSNIYVAGFTDNIGSRTQKEKLSQSRADAIVTFLWAWGIPAQKLYAEGYGDKFSVGDNHLIHGSAYNRRIEIQWVTNTVCPEEPMAEPLYVK